MNTLFTQLWTDEAGFIVSSELVLVATILILGMVVGLTEVAHNVNQELEDFGSALGSMNQSFVYSGFSGAKAWVAGSSFRDTIDSCDSECDIVCDNGPMPEKNEDPHRYDY